MNKIIILIVMFFATEVMAVCNEPISRTNFSPLTVLTSTKLNTDINDAYTRLNDLPGDCITDSTVTSAKILDGTIVNADISDGAAIARSKLAQPTYAISSSSGAFSSSSETYVNVTNLSASITTSGKPVEAYLVPDGSSSEGNVGTSTPSGTSIFTQFKLVRDSTDVAETILSTSGASSFLSLSVPLGSIRFFDTPSAGTYTYKIQVLSTASTTATVSYAKLIVREL